MSPVLACLRVFGLPTLDLVEAVQVLVLHIQDLGGDPALIQRVVRPILLERLEPIEFVIGLISLPDQLHQLFHAQILA